MNLTTVKQQIAAHCELRHGGRWVVTVAKMERDDFSDLTQQLDAVVTEELAGWRFKAAIEGEDSDNVRRVFLFFARPVPVVTP